MLNSKLFNFLYNKFFITNPEVFPYIKRRNLDQFPVKRVTEIQQDDFIKIVDRISEVTKPSNYSENPEKQAIVKEYEQQIDQMVYKLYDLTTDPSQSRNIVRAQPEIAARLKARLAQIQSQPSSVTAP